MTQKILQRTKYQHIISWGKMMGSANYFIENEVAEAELNRAPVDTIYRTHTGRWVTASELDPGHYFHPYHAKRLKDMHE